MSFNNCGNLSQIVDNSGNKITITYDSTNKKITKITDGTGHTFTFNYTSGTDYLYNIVDNAGRITRTCVYTNGVLTDVILNDGSRVYFRYFNTDEILLNYVWNTDGIGRTFNYTSQAKGRRVTKTMDFSADDVSLTNYVLGQVTTFDRTLYNTTTIRTPGIDGVHNTTSSANGSDDIITTLQFDNLGRTTSQQVKYGNGSAVGAGAYTYTDDDGDEESRNKIASSASLNKNTQNLLLNPSAESTSSWNLTGKTGDVAYTYACTADEAYYGTKSIKITNTSLSKDSYAYSGQSATGFSAGKNYTFSAYTKTNITSTHNYSNLQGAYLKVVARNSSSGILLISTSPVVKNTTAENIDNGWRRISVSFKLPADTAILQVYMMLGNAIGTAYFDGFQLEEGTTPNSVNLLENGSFEKYSSTAVTNWTATGITYTAGVDGSSTAASQEGSASVRIAGSATTGKGFYQIIPVAPNPSDTYIVSGWAAAYAVSNSFHSNAKFEIAVRVTYSCSDGTTVTQYKDSAVFNPAVSRWQYASSAFSLAYKKESGDTKTYTPTHVMVMPRFNRQANFAYFDHIQLIKDVASSYVYDSEGNVTSVSANAEQKNNMTYEGEDLKTYTDAADNTTSYTYDANHRLTQVSSPKGVKVKYTYNNQGQVTAVENINTGGAAKTKTTNIYTSASSTASISAGAYIYQTTDELNKTTTYGHNMATGAQTSVTDANNHKTNYGYNSDYTRLLRVLRNDTNIQYAYDGNRVSSITMGKGAANLSSEVYSFVYDSFGNVTQTKVGSTALVTNIYGSNNGLLQKSEYANGDAIRYQYNNAGLVTGIYQDNNSASQYRTFAWDYSSNGTPRVHKDGVTALKYDYSYDSIGRLIRTDISNSTSNAYVGSTEYGYDVRNNLTSISNDIGGINYLQEYSYSKNNLNSGSESDAKDNLPTKYKALSKETVYTYNTLNQLIDVNFNTTTDVNTHYVYNNYTDANGNKFYTNQLNCETLNGTSYHYSYDNVGNITEIEKGTGYGTTTSAYRTYTYDVLDRLKTETNGISNFTSTYTYDHLGNILQKDNTLAGTNHSKVTYTYSKDSSTGWNYLLTKLTFTDYTNNTTREETIDYDAIGNPLLYRGATLNWYGRQLKTFIKNGTTIAMTYDADGLRSTKQINGVKTEYQYVGDKLFYEKRGDGNSFYYFYDSYGKLSAIYHHVNGNKTAYHVVTNAQGDVIALYSWTGTKVAEYSYDAWGNCTIVSDTSSTHIATLNPFRYRSYYRDTDLGLYYLQSRYYDAEIGRFINADTTGLLAVSSGEITDKNLFAYCDNNPVTRVDVTGNVWETVFDLVSLGFSIYDVVKNPQDPLAWVGLAGDAIDLIPFVCGVGEAIKVAKAVDKVSDTIKITKAVDFTDEAADIVKSLDRSSGFTKSSASAGKQIHAGYKKGELFNPKWKEYNKVNGVRPDYVDFDKKIIYELKPMNPRSINSGIKQLQKYNNALGGGFNLVLELY